MIGIQSPTTRRRWLACISVLLGPSTAGCSVLSPTKQNQTGSTSTTEGTTQLGESVTTVKTTTNTMTTPDLNKTSYPTIQQQTEGQMLPEDTVILSTSDWRTSVSTAELTDETVQFVERTDFESSYVLGFEVEVTEWGYYLQLETVEQRSKRVRIEYSDVLVKGGPNVAQWRAMFIRLPRRDGVPETVTLNRTDNRK